VTTFTADRKHAGTDARVSLTLHGDALDATLPHLLSDSNHSEPFARNQVRGRSIRPRASYGILVSEQHAATVSLTGALRDLNSVGRWSIRRTRSS
jgi:hypothetical protein